tara:strand:- start:11 stop:472 length:462 start_codon:yes stop_codon:yes gene_type:complete
MNLEKFPKWLLLSVMKHFTDNIDSGLHVFIEGTERNTKLQGDWAEIRINGPDIGEVSKGCNSAECVIDILVASHIDYSNPILQVTNVGKVSKWFTDITLYEYGDGDAKIGCLKIEPTDNPTQRTKITNLGQIDPNLDLLQSTVVGNYKIMIFD